MLKNIDYGLTGDTTNLDTESTRLKKLADQYQKKKDNLDDIKDKYQENIDAIQDNVDALDDEIDGSKAVANAIFSDIGKVTKVSTFPLKIPYCFFASVSSINSFKNLTTVKESIFLLKEDIKLLKEIGKATPIIFFIVFLILVGM